MKKDCEREPGEAEELCECRAQKVLAHLTQLNATTQQRNDDDDDTFIDLQFDSQFEFRFGFCIIFGCIFNWMPKLASRRSKSVGVAERFADR